MRGLSCDDEVCNNCHHIAQESGLSMSAYIRSLMEADIKRRKEQLRLGHAKEVVNLRLNEGAGVR